MHQYIRPKKVMEVFCWLRRNNPLYGDITICQEWESQWKDDDADLWASISKQVNEEQDDSEK